MNSPLAPGLSGSWTRRRFITDLLFAGGVIVAAAWLSNWGGSKNEPNVTCVDPPANSPSPKVAPKIAEPVETERPSPTQHSPSGGAQPFNPAPAQLKNRACGPDPRAKRQTKTSALGTI